MVTAFWTHWSTFSPRTFRPPLVHHNTDRYNTIVGVHNDDTPFISSLSTNNSTGSVLHRRRIRKRRYHSKQSAGWLDSFVSSMNTEEATAHSSPTNSSTPPSLGEATLPKKSKKKKRASELYDSYSSKKIQTVLTSASVQVPSLLPTRPDDSMDTFAIPHSSFNETRSRSCSSNTGKKIYSMYIPTSQQPTHTPSSSNWEEDNWQQLYGPIPSNIIHTVGDWITDLAQEDDDDSTPKHNNRTHLKKYWKDRLEEQLDHALGIHEQGKLYNRWTKKAEQKEMELVDDDSRNKGLHTRNKRRKRKEPPSPFSSFWEDDGNILAVLLGKSKNTGLSSTWNSIAKRKQLDFKKFTMTTVMYLSFKFFLVFLSSLCRWASCRGSIPQPIVVFSLLASFLSAPRKKRWMIVGVTLIALRTCAEMIHGYMYGHDDWEEDESHGVEEEEDKGVNMKNSTGTKRR